MAPVAILSFAAVALGVAALKRRSDNRWVGALALAGAVVGVVVFLLVAVGFVAMLTSSSGISNLGG